MMSEKSKPWRDEETLRELYWKEGLSQNEMADRLGCSHHTVYKWMRRHDMETREMTYVESESGEKKWRDEETLREMYEEEGMGMSTIAEELGCSSPTIFKWLNKHGIETRTANYDKPPRFFTNDEGYETWRHQIGTDGKNRWVLVHRLLAVAEYGLDAIEGNVIHHENNIPWDNRPDNIEPMDNREHSLMHAKASSD